MFEPISTISNLAFVISGLIIYKKSRFAGIVTILLGVASGGWHWTMQPFWHTFDLTMMYFMLLSLINYSIGSTYTLPAIFAGLGMIGVHFLLPSHLIIGAFACILFLAMIRHYPIGRIVIIVSCFALWITTNIPYLHQWELSFWKLDVLHGISHICAAVGIHKAISYKPMTFFELTRAFKSLHLSTLKDTARADIERIIDHELNPVFGKKPVYKIAEEDISRFLNDMESKHDNLSMADSVRSGLKQIFEFATGRGISHNVAADI